MLIPPDHPPPSPSQSTQAPAQQVQVQDKMQQRPTCIKVRIRSTRDAHKIFYAVQLNLLPMITRRLDADERLALCSGCVYAWEERGPHTEITGLGIERFTEGRRWSPSRVRDEFLFYYEKYTPPSDAAHSGYPDKQPPRDWDPLVKQTYSVWVNTEKGRRKWHLTAYFTQATVDQLGTIDDLPEVANLQVPDGTFQSTRVSKTTRKGDDPRSRNSDVLKSSSSAVTRTYAPFSAPWPTPLPSHGNPSPSPCPPPSNPYRSGPYASQHGDFPPAVNAVPPYSAPPPPLENHHPLGSVRTMYEDSDFKRRPSVTSMTSSDYRRPYDYPFPPVDNFNRPPSSASSSRVSDDIPPRYDTYQPTSRTILPAFNDTMSHYGYAHHDTLHQPHELNSPRLSTGSSSHSSPGPVSHLRPLSNYEAVPHDNRARSHSPSPYAFAPVTSSPGRPTHISLPPPAQLLQPNGSLPLAEAQPSSLRSTSEFTGPGPCRVELAPLRPLQRDHPYRRHPADDKALRMLGPRTT